MPLPTHTGLYSGVMATIPSLLCTVYRQTCIIANVVYNIMVYIMYLNGHRLKMSGCI